jgi:hypothetical protein
MSGIFPDSGVPAHLALNTVDVPTTNCQPGGELFHSTSRCQPRFDPAAANALISELLNAVNWSGRTYDCSRLDNLRLALIAKQTQVIQDVAPDQNEYLVDHKGTFPNEILHFPKIRIEGDVTIIDVWDHTADEYKTFGVIGSRFFNNPIFYVTDGAPAPDTSLFTVAGNTVGNAFPSMAAAIAFIASAYIFGTVTFDIEGRVHNLTISSGTVKGANLVRIRPRDADAANLILEYGKNDTTSRGVIAGGGIQLTIQNGFVTEGFGINNSIGSINSAVIASGQGTTIGVSLDGNNPNSYIRHTGVHPTGPGISSFWTVDTGGTITIATANSNPDQENSSQEIFDLEPPPSDAYLFNSMVRFGAGTKFDQNGVDRVYIRDVHTVYDFNAPNTLGFKEANYGGARTSLSPFSKVYGPGNVVICVNPSINFGYGMSLIYQASTDDDAFGTSVENYKTTMRYTYRDGLDADLFTNLDRLSNVFFAKQPNVTGVGETYGLYYGTFGTDLPAGV